MIEVVALAAALADAGEDRAAVVRRRDVVDQLLNEDRLADARAAEQADLAALGIRADQVNDLDAGLEDLGGRFLLFKRRGLAVDGQPLDVFGHACVVQRFAQQIKDAAEARIADRDGDGAAGVDSFHAAGQSVGRAHGDAANHAAADLLLHLGGDRLAVVLKRDRVQQIRQTCLREADVEHRSGDLNDGADVFG